MIKKAHTLILAVFLLFLPVLHVCAADKPLECGQKIANAADHEPFIRQAFDLAISAGKKGNHPFGAVLVYQGKVVMSAENTVKTDKDFFKHAEMNLLQKARRELPHEVLRQSIMYASNAPCMICCSAMWYSDINRVVYGVSRKAFSKLTNYEEKSIPCEKLYQYTGKTIEWIGPVLEEEGLKTFCYWPEDAFRASIIKNLESYIGKACNNSLRRK